MLRAAGRHRVRSRHGRGGRSSRRRFRTVGRGGARVSPPRAARVHVQRRDRARGRAPARPAPARPVPGAAPDQAGKLVRRCPSRQDYDLPRAPRAPLRRRPGTSSPRGAAGRAARSRPPLRDQRRAPPSDGSLLIDGAQAVSTGLRPTSLPGILRAAVAIPVGQRRARFRELHAREQLFVMPNPWDVGSARLLASCGFEALATTSAGFAWSLGKLDQRVTRGELVAHVAGLAEATPLPLNVDSERCYPDDPGGVAETVTLLADAGAAGFSIEDYDPATGRVDDVEVAVERVATAAEAAHRLADPMVLTGRCENHIRGVDDLDDTI